MRSSFPPLPIATTTTTRSTTRRFLYWISIAGTITYFNLLRTVSQCYTPSDNNIKDNQSLLLIQRLTSENKRLKERIYKLEIQQQQQSQISSPLAEQRLEELPILIVGGSDGSGTRGVVDMLQRLRVDMIVQDTYNQGDVHGPQMFEGKGWPPLVEISLQANQGSLDYEFTNLTQRQQQTSKYNVQRLLQHLQRSYKQHIVRLERRQTTNNSKNNTNQTLSLSSQISFGFKAPVTMTVLPILTHVIGRPIKFIHVVREYVS
jgi:hypothetical protein